MKVQEYTELAKIGRRTGQSLASDNMFKAELDKLPKQHMTTWLKKKLAWRQNPDPKKG